MAFHVVLLHQYGGPLVIMRYARYVHLSVVRWKTKSFEFLMVTNSQDSTSNFGAVFELLESWDGSSLNYAEARSLHPGYRNGPRRFRLAFVWQRLGSLSH